jgi:hypothetical protein
LYKLKSNLRDINNANLGHSDLENREKRREDCENAEIEARSNRSSQQSLKESLGLNIGASDLDEELLEVLLLENLWK